MLSEPYFLSILIKNWIKNKQSWSNLGGRACCAPPGYATAVSDILECTDDLESLDYCFYSWKSMAISPRALILEMDTLVQAVIHKAKHFTSFIPINKMFACFRSHENTCTSKVNYWLNNQTQTMLFLWLNHLLISLWGIWICFAYQNCCEVNELTIKIFQIFINIAEQAQILKTFNVYYTCRGSFHQLSCFVFLLPFLYKNMWAVHTHRVKEITKWQI